MFANESEAYDSASVAPIHTTSKLSSDSDSASVASVNQALLSRIFLVLREKSVTTLVIVGGELEKGRERTRLRAKPTSFFEFTFAFFPGLISILRLWTKKSRG